MSDVAWPHAPITALVYREGCRTDGLLHAVCGHLAAAGARLVGFIQVDRPVVGRGRCDMILEELATGERICISEDRGPDARGCRLDVDKLVRALALAGSALDRRPDLVVVNKFGKTEAAGGGFRPLIAQALELSVPVLIAVPAANLDAWHTFAGDLAREFSVDDCPRDVAELCRHLGLATGSDRVADGGASLPLRP